MLSRVAEACYWMARYIERGENVARILDVNYHGVIENSGAAARSMWWSVVATTGDADAFFRRYPRPTERNVCEFLLVDRDNPNSVVNSVSRARENARRIRDRISSETWEELNRLYYAVNRQNVDFILLDGPYAFCRMVKNGSHLLAGVVDNTMPHDEGWLFVKAGRFLERTGMTARIIDSQAALLTTPATGDEVAAAHRWIAVLKSASAYEAYRKLCGGTITPQGVVELLLNSPLFPRSAFASVSEVESALLGIRSLLGMPGAGQAAHAAGALAARLRYTQVDSAFFATMHDFLDEIEAACNNIGDQVAAEYFWSWEPLRRGA